MHDVGVYMSLLEACGSEAFKSDPDRIFQLFPLKSLTVGLVARVLVPAFYKLIANDSQTRVLPTRGGQLQFVSFASCALTQRPVQAEVTPAHISDNFENCMCTWLNTEYTFFTTYNIIQSHEEFEPLVRKIVYINEEW